MPPKKQPELKAWTKERCEAGAKANLKFKNMSCGTDPDPGNSFCYRKNMADYNSAINKCPK